MHCLNLKVTYNCTNNCSFCFSSYLKNNIISANGLKKAVVSGYENGCKELVISGGEPTLLPDLIHELLKLAYEVGYEKFIIQTNGSGLIDDTELIAFLDKIARQKELCISFSVHGHTASIHDTMSSKVGAFDRVLAAINSMYKTSCKIYTNTVISSLNIGYLANIAELLLHYEPEIIQFSMMHLDSTNEISTGLFEAARAVHGLVGLVDLNILKTEGIPFCLMYGMEQCVGESYWPTELDLYNKDDDYMLKFNQLESGMRCKFGVCSRCVMDQLCAGIWKEHSVEFVAGNIHPIC